jgi:hypothetical protein
MQMIFVVIYWIMMKELEDYDWFPQRLRRYQVEFIGAVATWFDIYKPLVPAVQQLLQQNNLRQITDCCSGGGAPAVYMHRQLNGAAVTALTDKFPQPQGKQVTGVSNNAQSADILLLQPVKGTLYTMYNAFHHFDEAQQKTILINFAGSGSSFIIAEILQPDISTALKVFLSSTIGQLLLTPFIKPFSPVRLFFTYLLPVNIFTVAYDGIVSAIKSKTTGQYQQLVAGINTNDYSITVNKIHGNQANIIYIAGTPLHT